MTIGTEALIASESYAPLGVPDRLVVLGNPGSTVYTGVNQISHVLTEESLA